MKRWYALFFLISISVSLFSQKEIIRIGSLYIKAKQFDAANHYLDSVLKTNPKNVDALMMKGNVIINRDLLTIHSQPVYLDNDESIFEPDTMVHMESRNIVQPKTAKEVEEFWKKCLKLDSTRIDIEKGLCTMYAMALMKDKLKAQIIELKKVETDEGEQAYRMCEYARKFKERGKFDDAMDIYRFIAGLYPKLAGIRCDMASEYFYEGRLKDALLWMDSTFGFPEIDETTYLNGAFVYSEMGYFDNAENVLNVYSKKYGRNMGQFYYGLRLFADTSKDYYDVLKLFSETADSNSYETELRLSKLLLSYKKDFTINNYIDLAYSDVPEYYKILIHQRALKQYADSCEPFFLYGAFQCSLKNYSAAVQLMEDLGACQMNPDQSQSWGLQFGYALYRNGDKAKALTYLLPLAEAENPYINEAARYFVAKILIAQGKKEQAKIYLQNLVHGKLRTKYIELGQYLISTTDGQH